MSGGATSTTDIDAPREETADPGWRFPILVYGSVLAVLLVVSWQTITHVVSHDRTTVLTPFAGDWFWDGWRRMDGGWYQGIAESGYRHVEGQQSPLAFFPGYPLAVRFVGRAIDNIPVGGILVTIGCGVAAICLYWRWCVRFLPRASAAMAVAALAVYPYAWYLYGAVYGDALFLLAVLASFLLLERGHPVLAGVAGIVATSTRVVGLALLVGLVVGVLERHGAFVGSGRWGRPLRVDLGRIRRLRPADLGVLLTPIGLVLWSAWLWHRFGDPFLFSSVQEYWGQPSTPRTWFKLDFGAQLVNGRDPIYVGGLVVQASLVLGMLLLVPAVAQRFGLRYAAYQLVIVALPSIGSQDFQGAGRYLLAAFPGFAVVGAHLADRPGRARIVLPASAALLVLGTAWFAHGLYLS